MLWPRPGPTPRPAPDAAGAGRDPDRAAIERSRWPRRTIGGRRSRVWYARQADGDDVPLEPASAAVNVGPSPRRDCDRPRCRQSSGSRAWPRCVAQAPRCRRPAAAGVPRDQRLRRHRRARRTLFVRRGRPRARPDHAGACAGHTRGARALPPGRAYRLRRACPPRGRHQRGAARRLEGIATEVGQLEQLVANLGQGGLRAGGTGADRACGSRACGTTWRPWTA